VGGADLGGAVEVGDGARHPQHPVVAARGQGHAPKWFLVSFPQASFSNSGIKVSGTVAFLGPEFQGHGSRGVRPRGISLRSYAPPPAEGYLTGPHPMQLRPNRDL
jgi:hypothetical protein